MQFRFSALVLVALLGVSHEVYGADSALKGYKSPLVLLPPIEWADGDGSSPKEQAYFHGALETYGFILFSYWPRDTELEQQFSDFRRCVEDNKDRRWNLFGWLWGESLEASAAAQLIRETIPLVCQEYAGKGRGGWNPPQIIGKREWQSYSSTQRMFYVGAYVETALELMVLMQRSEDVTLLTQCMKEKGLDRILEELEGINFEWQHPMPWTVSRAVGTSCKGS